MRNIPQRPQHQKNRHISRRIVHRPRRRRHLDPPLRASPYINVVVPRPIMTYVFQRRRQRGEQLGVEVPGVLV